MIGGDGINDESNKTAPAPIINFGLSLFGVGEWVGGVVVLVG